VKEHGDWVSHINCLDGRVITASYDTNLHVYSCAQFLARVADEPPSQSPVKSLWKYDTLKGHMGAINHFCVLGRSTVVSASGDCSLGVWDLRNNELKQSMAGKVEQNILFLLQCMGGLAPESLLSSLTPSRHSILLSRSTGHLQEVKQVCPVEDNIVASASADGSVKLWDVSRGTCLQTLSDHTDWVVSLNRLDDGTFASGSWDSRVVIWKQDSDDSAADASS
jgi:WD40 repeat protein